MALRLLCNERVRLEHEMAQTQTQLAEVNKVGLLSKAGVPLLHEPLRDSAGFPRGDIALDKVLPLRRTLRMLQSDHAVLTGAIESILKTGIGLQEEVCREPLLGIIVSEGELQVGDIVLSPIQSDTSIVRVLRLFKTIKIVEVCVKHPDSIQQNMRRFAPPSHG